MAKKSLKEYVPKRDAKLVTIHVRMTEELKERLENLAEKLGESINLTCVCALEKVCDEEGIL